jgi:modulator of FtsH protease HflK
MSKRIVLLLPLLLFVAYLLTGVAQVRPGERAVVRRFGRVVAQLDPGLWVGLPWGMDRIDRVPVKFVQRLHVGFRPDADDASPMPAGQLLTGDQNLVNVEAAIDYSVDDGDAVVRYVLQRDRIEAALARAAEAAMAEWVAGRTVDEVLLTGKVRLRDWLMLRVQQRVDQYGLGIKVLTTTSLTWLAPPDDVRPEFERVAIAQSQMRTRENEANQDAEQKKRRSQSDADAMRQQAGAYAEGRKHLAEADAAAFLTRLEQYQRLSKDNPDVLTAIWWAEMGKVLAGMKANGQVDVLDERLSADGLDIMQFARPKKK